MTRLLIALASRPRLIVIGAVAANFIHPFIHGTPLDSGALDACMVTLSGAAMCHHEE